VGFAGAEFRDHRGKERRDEAERVDLVPRPHSHPHEQIAYIIEGRMMFYIGDEKHEVGPGGLVVIPGGVTHWGEVIGDEPVLNLDVFTPKRPEYAP
jgi:quercetin dioxygenase-like cupin family protein